MNDVYTAIMKAADQIERSPESFLFSETGIPDGIGVCGSYGCALGWIGAFLGVTNGYRTDPPFFVAAKLIVPKELATGLNDQRPDRVFYERMDKLNGADRGDWRFGARECARCLRLYADQYHGIPATVRELCEVSSCPTIPLPNPSNPAVPTTGLETSKTSSLSAICA